MSELIGASADPGLPPGGDDAGGAGRIRGRLGGRIRRRLSGGGLSGGGLQGATVWMAAGTGLSRLSGLLRVLVLAYALGATHLATGYNLANTTPNMIYDIVLGGVLSATFIPVFVDRLATRSEREAWRAISAVVTLSAIVLVAMTVLFWVAAPVVIAAFTVLGHTSSAVQQHSLGRERAVATSLLRWFVPQVALYGFIALVTALLNTRRRFVAPMWVPIANNVVCIAVLLWFRHLTDAPSLAGAQSHPGWVVLLGLGTTVGVALQALLLVLSLRGAGLSGLRWRWEPGHEAVRTVLRLGAWTFGFVMANQVALFVVLALSVGAAGPDPVSSYTYAYTFLQMPYAVVAVSVMSAVTPALAERWSTGDPAGFRKRLSGGLRAVLAIILPAAMGMFILAKPAVALLFAHGTYSVADADGTGAALAMFALGLPGFCVYLYVVRVLQAMQRTRTAFWLYLVENGINIVLAVALVHPLGVRGLALSLSVAYTAGAACGLVVLRRWLGPLGDPRTWAPLRRGAVATLVMGAVVLVVSNLSGSQQGFELLGRVLGSVVIGGLVYLGATAALGRRAERRDGRDDGGGEDAGPRRRVSGTRLVARASDRGGTGLAQVPGGVVPYGGGIEYGSGMGPGTGMVPAMGPVGRVRLVGSSSAPGPLRPMGSVGALRPVRPADAAPPMRSRSRSAIPYDHMADQGSEGEPGEGDPQGSGQGQGQGRGRGAEPGSGGKSGPAGENGPE